MRSVTGVHILYLLLLSRLLVCLVWLSFTTHSLFSFSAAGDLLCRAHLHWRILQPLRYHAVTYVMYELPHIRTFTCSLWLSLTHSSWQSQACLSVFLLCCCCWSNIPTWKIFCANVTSSSLLLGDSPQWRFSQPDAISPTRLGAVAIGGVVAH